MIKRFFIKIYWFFSDQFGIDPLRFVHSLRGLPVFFKDLMLFRLKGYTGKLVWMPYLHDRYEEAGSIKNEYFWQDLLVAQWIYSAHPERHVDVGSRVDGFVAHIASFRKIEVLDVRPITSSIPGVTFMNVDLMKTLPRSYLEGDGYCDSISCLHALEHFGLGRYGDSIDPLGHEKGLSNLSTLLKPGGILYLSVPIGQERIEFNANRVFDPRTILFLADSSGLMLQSLTVISDGLYINKVNPNVEILHSLSTASYNLGIFSFIRTKV